MPTGMAFALGAAAGAASVLALATIRMRRIATQVSSLSMLLRSRDEVRVPPDGGRAQPGRSALDSLEGAVREARVRQVAAQQHSDLLDQALQRVALGVVVGDHTGRHLFHNAAAEPFAGAASSDPVAEQAVVEVLRQAAGGAEPVRSLELYGPPRRSIVVRGFPLRQGSRGVGAVALLEDVSERRRIDAIRRDFVSNISHELRTPVGALAVIAEAIATEDSPDVIRHLAGRLEIDAHRLSQMLDDLLELSRIEASETPRVAVAVERVVTEAVQRAQAGAERRCVTIEVDAGPDGLAVLGDRAQLVSAVHNLLDNAVKYTDKNLPVRVEVGSSAENGRVVAEISVRDHGIGIPQRDRERIFERFYRVDKARTRDTGGTGLGLAIVRHVAVNHDGDVTVESLEGEGSTFVLRIPALAQPAGGSATAPAATGARTP